MGAYLADIRERLARVEERQNAIGEAVKAGFEKLDNKLDGFDARIRAQEAKAIGAGSLAGGVIAVAIELISAKLKGSV